MSTPAFDDDWDSPLWGAPAMAPVIKKSVAKTHYLLGEGLLDATKIGRQYVSTKRRLLAPFLGRSPNATATAA
jgi:hypothetical protein